MDSEFFVSVQTYLVGKVVYSSGVNAYVKIMRDH